MATVLVFIEPSGNIIKKCKITSLPLKEEVIIAKSIEFFNDDSPCFIHRSAVMKRLYSEIEEYFSQHGENRVYEWNWDVIPQYIRACLDMGEYVGKVQRIFE